ncbi:MAG: redoxin domain-containing protein [Bacteroidales bacterium]|jgi:peroxiredoxin|nr:redoxin domain-containing protein [Bacteroidales bacterium]
MKLNHSNNIFLFFFIFYLFLFVLGCNNSSDTIINCEITNAENKQIILEEILPDYIRQIDYKTIKNNKCRFRIKEKKIKNCFYRLKINEESIILYLKPKDNITFTADFSELSKNFNIEDSYDNKLIKEIHSKMLYYSDSVNYLKEIMRSESNNKIDNSQILKIFDEAQNFLLNLIYENKTSPVIYLCLYQYIDIYPVLTIDKNLEVFEFVCNNLEIYNPNLEQLIPLKSVVFNQKLKIEAEAKKQFLKIGEKVPDFNITDPNGKKITISQFLGKKVILYFWASWNEKSISQISKILQLRESKNAEIIFVSLDDNFRSWNNCLKDINLVGMNNVCDFKSWESIIVKIHNIKQLPHYIIIAEDGSLEETNNNLSL